MELVADVAQDISDMQQKILSDYGIFVKFCIHVLCSSIVPFIVPPWFAYIFIAYLGRLQGENGEGDQASMSIGNRQADQAKLQQFLPEPAVWLGAA